MIDTIGRIVITIISVVIIASSAIMLAIAIARLFVKKYRTTEPLLATGALALVGATLMIPGITTFTSGFYRTFHVDRNNWLDLVLLIIIIADMIFLAVRTQMRKRKNNQDSSQS